jgi:hypothetical protein
MIDDSEGLVTPHQAFCRVIAVNHPEKPDLGKEVTSRYWFRETPADDPDSIACAKACKILTEHVRGGRIHAQGIRPQQAHEGPKEINLAELSMGDLRIWDGTLEIRNDGRLYRDVFLSMADLNRVLGVAEPASPTRRKPAPDPRIRTEIRTAYADALNQKVKPPNIVELGKIVQKGLAMAGFYASQKKIQEIGAEGQFQKLRRGVGKTLASER